jgi:hypothetical protein
MVAKVTAKPKMEGRDMHMTLSPLSEIDQNRIAKKMAEEEEKKAAAEGTATEE